MAEISSERFRFGDYEVDSAAGTLRCKGVRVRTHRQAFRILQMLLAQPGRVVARAEIQEALWPDAQYGEFDAGINTAVRKLRRALNDSADRPRWIETMPTVGYRFIGELEDLGPSPDVPANGKAPSRQRLSMTATLVAAAVGAALLAGWQSTRGRSLSGDLSLRLELTAPPGLGYSLFSVSPDSTRIALVDSSDTPELWVRSLAERDWHKIEGAGRVDRLGVPFWSPDSSQIGFFADGKLKRVDLAGNPPKTLCEAPAGRGGTWNEEGRIVFAPHARGGLWTTDLSAEGCAPLIDPEPDTLGLRSPQFLPDGRRFLFVQRRKNGSVATRLGELGSQPTFLVREGIEAASYVEPSAGGPGGLIYLRDGSLRFLRWDPTVSDGEETKIPLFEGPSVETRLGLGLFSASSTGVLVSTGGDYSPRARRICLLTRDGQEVRSISAVDPLGFTISLAPREDWALTWGWSVTKGVFERFIYRLDLVTGTKTRLRNGRMPSLSRDGHMLFLTTPEGLAWNLIAEKEPTGLIPFEDAVAEHVPGIRLAYCDDLDQGNVVLFQKMTPQGSWDIGTVTLDGGETRWLLSDEFNEVQGTISPDGKTLAYVSDESGSPEVFLRRFPSLGGKIQISHQGGSIPRWRSDGSELYYVSSDGTLTAVPMKERAAGGLAPGVETPLFPVAAPEASSEPNLTPSYSYDVTADGQRFLALRQATTEAPPLRIVTNWRSLLE